MSASPFPGPSGPEKPPDLSIVIPAYNEEDTVAGTLAALLPHLEAAGVAWEIVVIDDGSSDRTAAVVVEHAARDPRIRLVRGGRAGKGAAIRRGMQEARGAWRFMADADLAMPPDNLHRFFDALADDPSAHVVIGSREAPGSQRIGEHWLRHAIGRLFNVHVRMVGGLAGIHDTQCGFKLFSAHAADTLFPRLTIDGFAFDVELLVLARHAGFAIREAGITWRGRPNSRVAMGRGAAAFLDVLRVRWNLAKGVYGPATTSRPPSPPGIPRSSSSSPSSKAAAPSLRSGTAASGPSGAPTPD